MALLDPQKFTLTSKNSTTIHKPTVAEYTMFNCNGKRIFQIDTFGTSTRANPGKVSQSIQIDEQMAKVIVSLLKKTFKI